MVRLQLPPAPPISLGLVDKWITGLLSITRAAVFSSIHSSINPQIHWFRVCMVSSIHSSTNPQIHFVGLPGRLISRTPPFEGEDGGASPSTAANRFPLGGEIESRLAYTQKSEGQHLPERPFCLVA